MDQKDTFLLDQTMDFVMKAHRGQVRKSVPIPYASHVFEVYKELYNRGIRSISLLQAALLHDTVEDCGITYTELKQKFGVDVADYVKEMTILKKDKSDKLGYFTKFKDKSNGALLLKLVDRFVNAKDWARDGRPNYAGQYGFEVAPLFYYFKERSRSIQIDFGDEAEKGMRKLISELFELYMNSFDVVDTK